MSENQREHLPAKRYGWTRKVRVGGQKIYIKTGEYPDGRLGEIFLTAAKMGALLQAMLDGWAIAISTQLQYGVPLAEIVQAFEHTRFEPCGPVQDGGEVKQASSIFDCIVKILKMEYLDRPPAQEAAIRAVRSDPPPVEKVAGHRSSGSGV
jgi:ribonucleoside-diphosphate reductase alpha chain